MKSTIRKNTYKAIYRLLDKVSPINKDCGTLCRSICCVPPPSDEGPLGIYLLPGEEKVFTQKESWISWSSDYAEDYAFPSSWRGQIYFINCNTAPNCPRNFRPLQCRFFPLSPHLTVDDQLILVYSTNRLPYSCPLIDEEMKLNSDFIKASHTVWRRLIKDSLIYDLVKMDSRNRYEYVQVFP